MNHKFYYLNKIIDLLYTSYYRLSIWYKNNGGKASIWDTPRLNTILILSVITSGNIASIWLFFDLKVVTMNHTFDFVLLFLLICGLFAWRFERNKYYLTVLQNNDKIITLFIGWSYTIISTLLFYLTYSKILNMKML